MSEESESTSLEVRVAALEAHMEHLRKDGNETRTNAAMTEKKLDDLKDSVSHLPRKGFIMLISMFLMAAAVATSAFQREIQQIIHIVSDK